MLDGHSVVVGFDGYVDELLIPVAERRNPQDWTAMASLADLGRDLVAGAGRNLLREVVPAGCIAGGCAINLGDGLAALGAEVHAFATVGAPRHPVFDQVAERFASLTTWGTQYGRTLALEFGDGKAMLCASAQLAELTPELAATHLADGAYAERCATADAIAWTDWSMYPHMTAIWQLLAREVLAALSPRRIFVDLVDPSGRSAADLRAALAVLGTLASQGHRVCLGLNLGEATCVAAALDQPPKP